MRYRSAPAATSGSVPFALRGPKSVRTVLSATVAVALGLAPAFLATSPAMATTSDGGLTIANAAATEGSDLTFSLRCAVNTTLNPCASDATYSVTASDDTATGGGVDYTAPTPTPVTYSATGTKTVTVHTIDDQVYEGTETFTLTASGPGGDVATAIGTIYDNETVPSYTLTASPASVTESGNSRTTVTATLSTRSALRTTISLGTANGTAVSGIDFDAPATPLIIEPGSLSNSTTIAILNDGVKDTANTETFTVNGTADNASPRSQSATVSIVDAQTTPTLTLSGPPVIVEGETATYVVHGAPISEQPMTVKWNAVKVTPAAGEDNATPGDDFQYLTDRTITIPAGQTTADILVPITADALNESTEDFAVSLSSPTNSTLGTITSVTTKITDGDTDLAPTVSVDPQAVTEGNAGKTTKTFTATLSQRSGRTVTVGWATDSDDAMAGTDFVSKRGTLVFPAGTLTQTFTVEIVGDTINEGPEVFDIDLTHPVDDTSANLDTPSMPITITDDDALPTVTFDNVVVKEGDAGNALLLPIKLSNASSHNIKYNLTDTTGSNLGSADNGPILISTPGSGDYELLTDSVTIPAGQLTGYAVVLVNGDAVYETDETAYVTGEVDTPSDSDQYVDGSAGTKTAKATLTNDDKAPNLTIDNVTGNEGETVVVTGSLSGASQAQIYVALSYAGGSVGGSKAAEPADFVTPAAQPLLLPTSAVSGATFPVGSIELTDDTTNESAETIVVSGISLGNATITSGSVTIAASDGGTTTTPPASGTAPTIMAPATINGGVAVLITGKADAGATVELWAAPLSATNAPLVKVLDTKASSTGTYSFSRWIGSGYTFQVKVGTLTSEKKIVRVQQVPVFVASSPSAGMLSLAVQGNPRGVGQTVIIQRYVNGAWVNTTWRGTTGADNLWKATVKQPAKSVWTLRAFVAGDTPTGLLPGYTVGTTITVK